MLFVNVFVARNRKPPACRARRMRNGRAGGQPASPSGHAGQRAHRVDTGGIHGTGNARTRRHWPQEGVAVSCSGMRRVPEGPESLSPCAEVACGGQHARLEVHSIRDGPDYDPGAHPHPGMRAIFRGDPADGPFLGQPGRWACAPAPQKKPPTGGGSGRATVSWPAISSADAHQGRMRSMCSDIGMRFSFMWNMTHSEPTTAIDSRMRVKMKASMIHPPCALRFMCRK